MHSACNTLPPLNDPGLDALQSAPLSYDAIMAALEEPAIPPPYKPKSPRAKALFALGLESKSRRADECGSKRIRRCPSHHDQFEEQHRTCRLKTCAPCAPRLAEERIARFWDNQPYMRNLKRFHWIVLHADSQAAMPSREDIQKFNTMISRWIKDIGDPRPGTGAVSHVAIESFGPDCENGSLDQYRFRLGATILFWGDVNDAILHSTAPGCMKHNIAPVADLRESVKELLTVYPPKSHEVCAQIELHTTDLRLIRTHGQMLKKDLLLDEDTLQVPVTEALVAEEGDTATNAQQPPTAPIKCCKKCGGGLTEVSNWIDRYTPVADLTKLTWTVMNNNPPPW